MLCFQNNNLLTYLICKEVMGYTYIRTYVHLKWCSSFLFPELPPEGSRIKAIAVYKSPVLLSENVECCASHREEGSKEGQCRQYVLG